MVATERPQVPQAPSAPAATSLMRAEAASAPAAVARLLTESGPAIDTLAQRLARAQPVACVTVARGSSDHAASHFAYLMLSRGGVLTSSLPPSAITLHHAPLRGDRLAAVAFSQSGQSPDLVQAMTALAGSVAATAALVNDVGSPLAKAVATAIDLCAGAERSVAATKSFIAQLVAGLRLHGAWVNDEALLNALPTLPGTLRDALQADWSGAVESLRAADRLYVIGRGAGLSIAGEMALKFKEVCAIQAEAFSSAEVRHGPMALVDAGYPVLVVAPRGVEQRGLLDLAGELHARGAAVSCAAAGDIGDIAGGVAGPPLLPVAVATHIMLDTVSMIQSFYPMVEALARARGLDPDRPRHLNKVTRTQ